MVFLVLALVGFGGEERTPHPLAPSIPLLTRAEYKRIEDVIERFIQFDIGKTKGGAANKKIVEEFNALGPEAIFPLIDGFNRGANMESSCPCVLIGKKIALILNASEDAHLLAFAKENIGAGVTARRHMAVVEDLRIGAQLRRTYVVRRFGTPPLFPSTRNPLVTKSLDELREKALTRGPQGKSAIEELGRRGDPKVLAILADASGEDSPNANVAQLALQKWIAKQPVRQLADLLKHTNGNVRRTAARQAGKQRSLAPALIELLADNDSAVAQTARASLTQLAGGLDFGPSPGASIGEREESVARWREWVSKGKK